MPSRPQIKCLHGEEAVLCNQLPQKSKVTAPNQRRGGPEGPGHVYASKTPRPPRPHQPASPGLGLRA